MDIYSRREKDSATGAEGAGQSTTAHGGAPGGQGPGAIVGIMLAAGAGVRFDPAGARYKLVQPLPDGRPVVRAACQALLPAVDRLLVIAGERAPQVRAALQGLPLDVLDCPRAALGMGATLKHGVAASCPTVGWVVALGDMPFLQPASVASVANALRAGAVMARPRHAGRPGHPVGFAATLRADLLALDDGQGAAPLLRRRAADVAWLEVAGDDVLRDVDVPADLDGAAPA